MGRLFARQFVPAAGLLVLVDFFDTGATGSVSIESTLQAIQTAFGGDTPRLVHASQDESGSWRIGRRLSPGSLAIALIGDGTMSPIDGAGAECSDLGQVLSGLRDQPGIRQVVCLARPEASA